MANLGSTANFLLYKKTIPLSGGSAILGRNLPRCMVVRVPRFKCSAMRRMMAAIFLRNTTQILPLSCLSVVVLVQNRILIASSKTSRNILAELESHVRLLRGENYEYKRALQHLFTLAQVTNKEVRDSNNKLNEKVVSFTEVLDNGCPCSVNLDAQIKVVHYSVRILEGKIDSMRAEIRSLKQELLKDHGGTVGGKEHQPDFRR